MCLGTHVESCLTCHHAPWCMPELLVHPWCKLWHSRSVILLPRNHSFLKMKISKLEMFPCGVKGKAVRVRRRDGRGGQRVCCAD